MTRLRFYSANHTNGTVTTKRNFTTQRTTKRNS